jgi:PKD repeat protein
VTPCDGQASGEPVTLSARIRNPIPLAAASSCSPCEGQAPLPVNFAATASGGTPPYTFAWDFGDGGTSDSAETAHTYASPGAFSAKLAVTDALGDRAEADALPVGVSPVPPGIAKLSAKIGPFRIVAAGSNLQDGIRVAIDGVAWPDVALKSPERLVIRGGSSLKEAVPRGAPAVFTFINPDGGTTAFTWVRR